MTEKRWKWAAAGIAIVGFLAGTAWHPITMPAVWSSRPRGDVPLPPNAAMAADRAFRHCDGLGPLERRECYEKLLVPVAEARGPKDALAILTQLATMDKDVRSDAHDYAHAIGVAAFRAHKDVAQIFPDCGVEFQSGCYHGVIQAFFMDRGAADSTTVRAVCSPWTTPSVYGWLRFQCTHGLGHGLTMLLDHDLPDALTKCDLLRDDWDRDACYGGAFMENVIDATQPKHEMGMSDSHVMHDAMKPKFKEIDRGDPAYPCTILAEKYLTTCWTNQASIIEVISNYDIAKVGEGCDRAPERYVRWCYTGLGTDLNGQALSDPERGLEMCDRTGTRHREWCYVGLAKNLIEVTAKPSDGIALCKLVTRDAWKIRCYEAIGEEIASVTDERAERTKLCTDVESAFVRACEFGARLTPTRPPGLAAVD